jgi:glutamyl-tRNA synthetase
MVLSAYRGRIAPSPTGYLHLGHASTFWIAQARARQHRGVLVLRNEDLDPGRCKPHFVSAMFEDLKWFGFEWQEGPDCGGPFGPYAQSERGSFYLDALEKLRSGGLVYPCVCSRQDVIRALQAPHEGQDEPIYPGTCRPRERSLQVLNLPKRSALDLGRGTGNVKLQVNWRFRVPDGETISFVDGYYGGQRFAAGRDFGDFIIWRHDNIPAYQLAVVVDDAAMQITEVVRGADLLKSTARQILLYRALGLKEPAFYHCPLLTDDRGVRLAKRDEALSLRRLRVQGASPESLRERWQNWLS